MKCNICNGHIDTLFEATVLNKYNVSYYKCKSCSFIQTEKPYWLEEAYTRPISELDLGYLQRNIYNAELLDEIISKNFNTNSKFIDFGGGYGMLVRLMRNRGFDFYRYDTYCDNLFSQFFDVDHESNHIGFELLTSFEVFEHLENPMCEIEKMFEFAPSVLFSTELVPFGKTESRGIHTNLLKNWWYFSLETGQHIALYSLETLKCIAQHYDKNLYTNGHNLHLFSDKSLPKKVLFPSLGLRILRRLSNSKRPSLEQRDINAIKTANQSSNNFR
ncbi:MAG: class I SAM-dependent methyltransferase [Saprospiraceae bacterium]